MAHGVQPWKVVVTADQEVETSLLRSGGVADKRLGAALLGHQGIAESGHRTFSPVVVVGPALPTVPATTRRTDVDLEMP